jgi:hypothetical protein
MTKTEHSKLQNILSHLATIQADDVELAIQEQWKPFVLSLSNEEDRVLAFQTLYEWQIDQLEQLLKQVKSMPSNQSSDRAAA